MAASNLPVFVIVPGAWHPPSCYEALATHLKNANFTASVARLLSLNSSQPLTATCFQDSEAIRNEVLLPLIENEGRDVLLVTHSYGGIAGGGAAHGLSKVSRLREGKKGGIIGLAYLTAFVVPEGGSVIDYFGGHYPPFVLLDQPSQGQCKADSSIQVLYNDLDAQTALALEQALLPHSLHAFESPASPQAWTEPELGGRLAFLRCTEDKRLPMNVQNMFTERSEVEWFVKDLDSGHSPFVSRPKETTDFLVGWANHCLAMSA